MQNYDPSTSSGIKERGLTGFVARARQLAERYGDRFTPTARLVEMAEKGESFPA
jgi:3-hydroxyacyl-CoA dehydrogenase/enoyl-CoA hydratase/3-hydroxybutyryl-CoA epimerase